MEFQVGMVESIGSKSGAEVSVDSSKAKFGSHSWSLIGNVDGKFEGYTLVEALGAESGPEVGSSNGFSGENVESNVEGYTEVSDKGASEERVIMTVGALMMGVNAVTVSVVAERYLRLEARYLYGWWDSNNGVM